MSKKREAECVRLRKEMEDASAASEEALTVAKVKFQAALSDAQDECEALKKSKAK